jgi:hypothetical protein
MRLWSLHLTYLDAKGLVALWRESLLAKHVLEGKTKGYKNHPQLDRFKNSTRPLDAINQYLAAVHTEGSSRDYHFDREKINWNFQSSKLTVTKGQIEYEVLHLLKKLRVRDQKKYRALKALNAWKVHPLFEIVEGEIETWEII